MAEAIFPPLPSGVFVLELLSPAEEPFRRVSGLREISVRFKFAHEIHVGCLAEPSRPAAWPAASCGAGSPEVCGNGPERVASLPGSEVFWGKGLRY